MVSYHLHCHRGASDWTARRRPYQVPMDRLIQKGDSSSRLVGVRASDAQWNPVRCRNQRGEGSTTHQNGKNLASNSGLPHEAEGELDHFLMRQVSNCLFLGWNHVSQVQGAGWKYCVVWECVKLQASDAAQLQSKESWSPVLGELIGSRVSPNRPPVWGLGQRDD
jgi:hypothetical protein